jgi:hypothetical protein
MSILPVSILSPSLLLYGVANTEGMSMLGGAGRGRGMGRGMGMMAAELNGILGGHGGGGRGGRGANKALARSPFCVSSFCPGCDGRNARAHAVAIPCAPKMKKLTKRIAISR